MKLMDLRYVLCALLFAGGLLSTNAALIVSTGIQTNNFTGGGNKWVLKFRGYVVRDADSDEHRMIWWGQAADQKVFYIETPEWFRRTIIGPNGSTYFTAIAIKFTTDNGYIDHSYEVWSGKESRLDIGLGRHAMHPKIATVAITYLLENPVGIAYGRGKGVASFNRLATVAANVRGETAEAFIDRIASSLAAQGYEQVF